MMRLDETRGGCGPGARLVDAGRGSQGPRLGPFSLNFIANPEIVIARRVERWRVPGTDLESREKKLNARAMRTHYSHSHARALALALALRLLLLLIFCVSSVSRALLDLRPRLEGGRR